MTHDGPVVCKQLEEYLISKLAKDHSGVKYKVLKMIRFLCENECSAEFRRLIQRKADSIRPCQSYRGSPDPLRGDSPNKAVRDEATATMQALFAAENSGLAAHLQANPLQSRIQGIGSTDFGPAPSARPTISTSTSSMSSGPRQMESMGNPHFNNYAAPATSMQSIMQSDNPTKQIISAMTSGVQSVAQTLAKAANPYLPTALQQTESFYSTPSLPQQYSSNYQAPRSDWTPPKLDPVHVSSAAAFSSEESHGVKSAVNELCMANPARVVPSQQSLDVFVAKANALDGLQLATALTAKLTDASVQWTHKMKVLAGLEALHLAGLDIVTQSIKENPVGLFSLLSSPQCGAKARQVAGLVGILDVEPGKPAHAKLPTTQTEDLIDVGLVTGSDLLDFDDSGPAGSAVSLPAPKTVHPTTEGDLLDFGDIPVSRSPSPSVHVASSETSLI